MKKIVLVLVVLSVFLAGCESLRFAPTEIQKQNAWLHDRTAAMIVQQTKLEDSSEQLQNLSQLSEVQSRVITAYYGLPKEYPAAQTIEELLSQSNSTYVSNVCSTSLVNVRTITSVPSPHPLICSNPSWCVNVITFTMSWRRGL